MHLEPVLQTVALDQQSFRNSFSPSDNQWPEDVKSVCPKGTGKGPPLTFLAETAF